MYLKYIYRPILRKFDSLPTLVFTKIFKPNVFLVQMIVLIRMEKWAVSSGKQVSVGTEYKPRKTDWYIPK